MAPDLQSVENSLQINTANDLEKTIEIVKNSIFNYLNAGGTTEELESAFQNSIYLGDVQLGDITNDGVPEVFVWIALPRSEESLPGPLTIGWIKKFFPMPVTGTRTFVFTCTEGEYEFLGAIKDDFYNDAAMPTILDLNADGISEIVQPFFSFAGSGYGIYVSILNWNGSEFINSLYGELREDWMSSFSEGSLYAGHAAVRSGNFSIQDIDNNGTKEVVLSSDDFRAAQPCELLYRDTKMVLMWNGTHFFGFYSRTLPQYRIQAVWDGDHQSVHGLQDHALSSYQKVLDDETLLSWSPDYNIVALPLCGNNPWSTPIPVNPLADKDEAPRLEAYSLYRLMLLRIVQGDLASAEENYKLLQANYQNAYQELAKIFWEKYIETNSIHDACLTTISYAEMNQEQVIHILDRRTYGNLDSLTPVYQPEDICPFK